MDEFLLLRPKPAIPRTPKIEERALFSFNLSKFSLFRRPNFLIRRRQRAHVVNSKLAGFSPLMIFFPLKFSSLSTRFSHQVDLLFNLFSPRRRRSPGRSLSVVLLLLREDLLKVRDVRSGQPQRVQLGQLRVRRDPGQGQLQPPEGLAEDTHPRPLAGVGGAAGNLKFTYREKDFSGTALSLSLSLSPSLSPFSTHPVFVAE